MLRRSGFTLVEVMVALLVSAVVLLGARALMEALADHAQDISRAATAADRDANAERTLRALAERLEVGTAPGTEFSGDPSTARFTSWCEVPAGWLERCEVSLSIARDADGYALIARTSVGDAIRIRSGFHAGTIRYLDSPAAGGTWIRVWGEGITAPIALGVIIDRDTIIVRIGERG